MAEPSWDMPDVWGSRGWPASAPYAVGQVVTMTVRRKWWAIWLSRLRSFKWRVPQFEQRLFCVTRTSDS